MADHITVVVIGWHVKETVQVPFHLENGLLQFKDRIRAALGSAAQGQVCPICLHVRGCRLCTISVYSVCPHHRCKPK